MENGPDRAALARRVLDRGFLVDVAADADEAIALCERSHFSAISVDLASQLDAFELVRALSGLCPQGVFVVVTRAQDVDVPDEPIFRDRVASVLPRPYDPDDLVEALHRCARLCLARRSVPPAAASPVGPDAVLLIEDTDSDARLTIELLSRGHDDWAVTHVRRLSDALELLETRQFRLIITDLSLPDARGLDAVIRLQHVATETPLLVLSGMDDEPLAVQAVQAGAQDCLVKGEVDTPAMQRAIRYANERKRSELSLARQAHTDPLTGLANRTQFHDRLTHALKRVRRSGMALAVAFVDLDQFKPVNDRLGHEAGDRVLVETSRRLLGAVRESDTVARLGGDEFGLLLDSVESADELAIVAERVRAALAAPITIGEHTVTVTASIGLATYPEAGISAMELTKAADTAMYAAKRSGRNTFELFQGQVADSSVASGSRFSAELERALSQSEFSLFYQPQYDAASDRITAAEGLLRWRRHGQRMLPPAEFLPQLEASNDIVGVGAWVIRAACQELRRWKDAGIPNPSISVNVSARQLESGDLVQVVRQALQESDLDPDSLELELTESLVMSNPERAKQTLFQLKDAGVRLAIDDFGTGQSSLAYLYRLPMDAVKIDRAFVRDLEDSAECQAVTCAIIALAKQLTLEVVAEGVETAGQREFLRQAGCDRLQGFLLGRPMLAGRLRKLLTEAQGEDSRSRVTPLFPPRMGPAPWDLNPLRKSTLAGHDT